MKTLISVNQNWQTYFKFWDSVDVALDSFAQNCQKLFQEKEVTLKNCFYTL
jgi:hypothetical protein